jgi:DNA repair ATPase RecN
MKLRVRNFQTAKDTSLEVKGFTVVIGKSNTGKTSVLRAVEASLFNDSITGCVRYGEKDAAVTLEMDGLKYTWEKGETKNAYTVETPEGKKEYSRVGFQRPDQLEKAGFKEFRIDGEQYPIRPQIAEWHSPIFLLNKTGKVVTELMASVTRLDVINMAIRKCSTNLRKSRSTLNVREEDAKKAKRRSLEFDVLDDIETPLIERLYRECLDLQAKVAEVEKYIGRMERMEASIAGLSAVDAITVPAALPSTLEAKIKEVGSYITRHDKMEASLQSMTVLDSVVMPAAVPRDDLTNLAQVSSWITKMETMTKKIEAAKGLDSVTVPEASFAAETAAIADLDRMTASLVKLGRDLNTAKEEIKDLEASVQADETALVGLRGQIQECPVCGRSDHG